MAASTPNRPYPERLPPVALVCGVCGAEFERPAWRVRQAARSGTAMRCSYECVAAARRVHTPESKAEYHRAYRERNRAWINEKQNAARHGPNRERTLERQRERYREQADMMRARARAYAEEHRAEAHARRKAWPDKNPERHAFHVTRSNIATATGMRCRDIPAEIVVAHMEYLSLRRAIRDARSTPAPDASPSASSAPAAVAAPITPAVATDAAGMGFSE